MRAYAAGSLAICAYFTGRPLEGVRHARVALAFGGLEDVGRRRLLAIAARAYGHLGDSDQAGRAMAAAAETDTGTRDDLHDGVGGEFAFDEERLAMSTGTTALLTGDGEQAETMGPQGSGAGGRAPGGPAVGDRAGEGERRSRCRTAGPADRPVRLPHPNRRETPCEAAGPSLAAGREL
ncbi:hypothetical protein [Streptomyces sp. NPDC090445]|uniref:hypothetical protein n=1 Tax=Streptomyces sp. NPDC090445 TaxID=3365963 RepID=UPI00380F12FA